MGRLFSDDVQYTPPPRYQLRVLKELMKRIEASIQDWDEQGISDDLMNCLAVLLSTSLPSEETSAQQKAYVTYSLSSLTPQFDPNPSITLHEARNILAAAGTTGLRTWEAGFHLGNYLCSNPEIIRGKSILELGSGTGYISILCAKYLEAGHVLATDGDDDVVASFSTNFYLNGLQEASHIEGKELKWGHALTGGEDPQWNLGRHIDLVLGVDLTYDPRNIPPLLSTFGDLFELYPDVEILIAATVRSEETFAKFPDACKRNGYRLREINFEILKVRGTARAVLFGYGACKAVYYYQNLSYGRSRSGQIQHQLETCGRVSLYEYFRMGREVYIFWTENQARNLHIQLTMSASSLPCRV